MAYLTNTHNAGHLIVLDLGCQVAAAVVLLVLLDRVPERPGRDAAIGLAAAMLWLPLVGPVLTLLACCIL